MKLSKIKCWFGLHNPFTNSDLDGVWGECKECGKKTGYITFDDMGIDEDIRQQINERTEARKEDI